MSVCSSIIDVKTFVEYFYLLIFPRSWKHFDKLKRYAHIDFFTYQSIGAHLIGIKEKEMQNP